MDEELNVDAMIEAPEACDDIIELDESIEDIAEPGSDIEEEIEEVEAATRSVWEESDTEFTRYERNYRARRIRELTKAPIKKGRIKAKPTSDRIAA